MVHEFTSGNMTTLKYSLSRRGAAKRRLGAATAPPPLPPPPARSLVLVAAAAPLNTAGAYAVSAVAFYSHCYFLYGVTFPALASSQWELFISVAISYCFTFLVYLQLYSIGRTLLYFLFWLLLHKN